MQHKDGQHAAPADPLANLDDATSRLKVAIVEMRLLMGPGGGPTALEIKSAEAQVENAIRRVRDAAFVWTSRTP